MHVNRLKLFLNNNFRDDFSLVFQLNFYNFFVKMTDLDCIF